MTFKGSRSRSVIVSLTIAVILCLPQISRGQALYSYTDEQGVRVFTNIPPKEPVRELKVTGVAIVDEKSLSVLAINPPSKSARGKVTAAAPTRQALPSPSMAPDPSLDPIIEKYANQYRLDPSLVRSIIATESGFKPDAVSNKGARGLMQLMPATASRLGVRDLFDPEENIRGGVKHMRNLLDTFDNDLELSLAAYNAGENLVQRVGRIPNIKETHDYVRSITQKYGKKEMAFLPTEPPSAPSTFRWIDQNGILHLTNTPPVEHSEPALPLLIGSSQTPQ